MRESFFLFLTKRDAVHVDDDTILIALVVKLNLIASSFELCLYFLAALTFRIAYVCVVLIRLAQSVTI